ncbi:S1C family serine protease [Aquibacillus salsiterrae]|uniref:Serine protease n=1 Tax=Aquibacillus salsiterrae TaxID=2950439 RepID=A0A9X4AF69_9BACI|nr:serine protease [Aquibacillus salsiterrae]MDC3417682.1 serine protease [Aquibacillus salsiterrae]
MGNSDYEDKKDIIDEDLYEEIDDEEMYELIEQQRKKIKQRTSDNQQKTRRIFPKWVIWLIASAMVIQVIAIIPKTFSIPAIDFLVTSARLSTLDVIEEYQKSVVVIEAGNSRGTGFSISEDGLILTNHHVIEDETNIMAAYPEDGLFDVDVIATYPDIDLALLKVEGNNLPFLELADKTTFEQQEPIYFIGNPLRFQGIANEGEVIGYTELDDWDKQILMLDAPIYKGNSGSPVISMNGQVIGVVFATLNDKDRGRVGLAVPIDYFHEAYQEKY